MRPHISWPAAALCVALSACTPPQPAAETETATTTQEAPAPPVHSRGVVYAVTREYNAITIQHEAIPEYNMPPMVMEFTVDNPSQLDGLEPGDNVTFELRSGLDISTISEVARNQ